MDCPVQTVDPRLAQTIHGLSQAQRDELNTYPKPQRLQHTCRIPNPKYETLASRCVANCSPLSVIASYPFSLWHLTLCYTKHGSAVCADNPWIVAQSMDPRFAQGNPRIVPSHNLRITNPIMYQLAHRSSMKSHDFKATCLIATMMEERKLCGFLLLAEDAIVAIQRNCESGSLDLEGVLLQTDLFVRDVVLVDDGETLLGADILQAASGVVRSIICLDDQRFLFLRSIWLFEPLPGRSGERL